MDYTELVQRVGWGEEFQFYYKDESYWISKNEKGFYLTRSRDRYTLSFKTSEELFKDARVDNKTISEIWDMVEL